MQEGHGAVRRRVRRVELLAAAGAVVLFAGSAALARLQFAGHRKMPTTSLTPPEPLLRVVRRNQLAAGILAPVDAPPGIGSAPS